MSLNVCPDIPIVASENGTPSLVDWANMLDLRGVELTCTWLLRRTFLALVRLPCPLASCEVLVIEDEFLVA